MESIESCLKVVKTQPASSFALSELAEAYKNKERYGRAIAYYFKALSLESNNLVVFDSMADTLTKYCQKLVKENDLNRLIAVYRKFLAQKLNTQDRLDKTDGICALFGDSIRKLSIRQGNLDLAGTFFQEIIDRYLYKEWGYYGLGNVLVKQNKTKLAITCYESALKIRPNFPLFLLSLGELLLNNNEKKRAFEYGLEILKYQGAFRRDVRANQTLINLLSVNPKNLKFQKKLEEAIALSEKSNAHRGIKKIVYRNIGQVLEKRDKLPKAIKYYQKSLRISLKNTKPKFVEHHWQQGKLKEPDFLILGFGKCGTSSFYSYLCQHPQMLPAISKEPCYLGKLATSQDLETKDWSLPSREKDFYQAHFAPRDDNRFITGEASTTNFVPGCDTIISNWFPKIKLVVLLRDPVSRTISHYEQNLKGKRQNLTFEETINRELAQLETATNIAETVCEKVKAGWEENLAMSMYVYPLQRWMNTFSKEQFLIIDSDDLIQKPKETMDRAFDFLQMDRLDSIKFNSRNVGSYPSIDDTLKSRLSRFFEPHNQKLEKLLDRKFNWGNN